MKTRTGDLVVARARHMGFLPDGTGQARPLRGLLDGIGGIDAAVQFLDVGLA